MYRRKVGVPGSNHVLKYIVEGGGGEVDGHVWELLDSWGRILWGLSDTFFSKSQPSVQGNVVPELYCLWPAWTPLDHICCY